MIVLKEAWKWSYGIKLGTYINKTLDSGAISPLLITVNMDYADDIQVSVFSFDKGTLC